MTQTFNNVLPYYLHIGMTPSNFWDDSPYLAIAFRKAYDLRIAEQNQMLWLQGLYNYKAFGTVIDEFSYGLNGKKGKKPESYIKSPIPITEYEKERDRIEKIQHTLEWVRKGQK